VTLKEVQLEFLAMKKTGPHPSVAAHSGKPVSQIIKRTKPPAFTDDSIDIVAWFAQWLRRWSLSRFQMNRSGIPPWIWHC
jgi:hypothetical protein